MNTSHPSQCDWWKGVPDSLIEANLLHIADLRLAGHQPGGREIPEELLEIEAKDWGRARIHVLKNGRLINASV